MLHIINGEDYAGAERVQDTLALRLPDYGYEVGFACLKPGLSLQRGAAAITSVGRTHEDQVRPLARSSPGGGRA